MLNKLKIFVDGINNDRPPRQIASIYLESETNGFLPFNTASIRIKAFYDNSKSERIGNVSYKWFREFEGRSYAIENIEEFHNVSCEDIGSKILVAVTDNDRSGVQASLSFGPIILDPQVRIELETALNLGKGVFEVQYPYSHIGNEALTKPTLLKNPEQIIIDELILTEANLAIIHSKGHTVNLSPNSLKIEPLQNFPLVVKIKVEEFHKELDFFELQQENGQFYFYVKFFNRVYREHFLLLAKLFKEVRLLPYLSAIEEIKRKTQQKTLFSMKFANVLAGNQSLGDLLLQNTLLRETLGKNVTYTKSVQEEKEALIDYCQSLENDLQATLKELKSLVEKRNLHEHVDISRLQQVEKSILQRERSAQDPLNAGLVPDSFRNIRSEKLKTDNDKLQKLNKLLLKELNTYREKKKEKIKLINQSLTNLQREVQSQANNLDFVSNQSLNVSKYLDNFQTDFYQKSMVKKSRANIEEELKLDLVILEQKINLKEIIPKTENVTIDLEKQIDDLRSQVRDLNTEIDAMRAATTELGTKNTSKSFLDRINVVLVSEIRGFMTFLGSFSSNHEGEYMNGSCLNYLQIEDFKKQSLETKNKILNTENQFLASIIEGILVIIEEDRGSIDPFQTSEIRTTSKLFENFRETIEKLNSEVHDLQEFVQEEHDKNSEEKNPLFKQNNILKSEIEKLKTENEAFKLKSENLEKMDSEGLKDLEVKLTEKDRIIEQLRTSNANLAGEIQNLQQTKNELNELN